MVVVLDPIERTGDIPSRIEIHNSLVIKNESGIGQLSIEFDEISRSGVGRLEQ